VTLRDALRGRHNGLNLVRLVLAGMVVVCHSWVIGGFPGNPFTASLGSWAVHGFFSISGYLIASSRLRLRWAPFMMRRAVRILPGYWVCLLVTAFCVAPLLAVARGVGFDAAAAVSFVRNNWWLWVSQQTIGHTLATARDASSINVSLWTLPHEALAYVLVGLLLGSAVITQRLAVSSALMFACVVGAHAAAVSVGLPQWQPMAALRLGGFFTAGMFLYAIGDRVTVDWRFAAVSTVLVMTFGVFIPSTELLALPLAYLILWCGATSRIHWGAINDYSYGAYIYAFPAQQLLAAWGMNRYGPWVFTLLSFVAVAPLAVLSWWFVERPVLRLANRRRDQPAKPASSGAALQAAELAAG
jgi:peptidoglycan/LPS O-acetylase OafA/YrhL